MNRRLKLAVIVILGMALLTFLNLVGDWGRLSGGMSNLGVFCEKPVAAQLVGA